MKWIAGLLLALFATIAQAQDALVVQTCGTNPQTYAVGSTRLQTVDVNGRLCLNTSGAGNLVVGTSTITGGVSGRILYDNASVLGELPVGTGVATALGNTAGGASGFALVSQLLPIGGSNLQVQYNNNGAFGGYTNTQLTALINPATSSLPGTLPTFPGNTTTFFRGDGTYTNIFAGNLVFTPAAANTELATMNLGTLTVATKAINITGTWNANLLHSPPIFSNITVTSSNNAGKLIQLQRSGTDMFSVSEFGAVNSANDFVTLVSFRGASNTSNLYIGLAFDTILSRCAAACWQHGTADVATAAVAQTITAQGNTGAANGPLLTLRGPGAGNGQVGGEVRISGGLSANAAGTGGAITGYTAPAAAGNVAVLAWAIDPTGVVKNSKGFTVGTLPTPPAAGYYGYVTDQLTTCAAVGAALVGGGAVTCPVFFNGSIWVGG